MKFRSIGFAMLITALAVLVFTTPVTAAGEAYGSLSGDWVLRAQDSLQHAAMSGPKWHSQRTTIERYLTDVNYVLQSTALAAWSSDHAVAAINAQEAIRLLERGVHKGFFRQADIEPILAMLRFYGSYVVERN